MTEQRSAICHVCARLIGLSTNGRFCMHTNQRRGIGVWCEGSKHFPAAGAQPPPKEDDHG